jgi:hypothetical protein
MALYDEQTYAVLVECNDKYIRNLCYLAPEAMTSFARQRNPVVLMAKMAQLAPTKEILAQFVSLAQMAAKTPTNDMFSEWWVPMCHTYLSGVLGDINGDGGSGGSGEDAWKKACVALWADEHMMEQDVPLFF